MSMCSDWMCYATLSVALHCFVTCIITNSVENRDKCVNNLLHHIDVELRLRHQPNHTAYNIRNNSIVHFTALGTLLCTTPYQHCCQNRGHWHYPNGSVVPTSQSGALLFTSRLDRGLGLQRRISLSHESVDGVYKCLIPDQNGITHTLYAWIYSGPLCKFLTLIYGIRSPVCTHIVH